MKKVTLLAIPLMSLGLVWSSSAFAATDGQNPDPASRKTPVSASLISDDTNPVPPVPEINGPDPSKPDETGPTGPFALSYVPRSLETASTKLKDSGEQTIPFTMTEAQNGHVGVKDKTRGSKGWQLTAALKWTDKIPVAGAKIEFSNGDNPGVDTLIKNNKGTLDGSNPAADLQPLTAPEKASISSGGTAGSTVDAVGDTVEIMSATDMTEPTNPAPDAPPYYYNGVYDYKLGKASLILPETNKIKVGQYAAEIQWNLGLLPVPTP